MQLLGSAEDREQCKAEAYPFIALLCKGSTSAFDAESTGSNPVRADSLVLGIVPAGMRFLAVQLQCVPADDDGDAHKHASQC